MTVAWTTRPGNLLLKFFGACALVLAIGLYLLWGKWPVPLLRGPEPRVLYEVPENVTATQLVEDLHQRRLIAFPQVLKGVLRVTGWEKRLRAGFYYLPPRNSVMEIARKLTSGEMATRPMTIPEGKTSWEAYGILRKYFPLDSLVFDSLIHSPEFAERLGIDAPSLEGYLYPDTYVVPWKLKERDVIRLMVSRFQEVMADLDLDSDFVERYGVHGLVTLASIVEKESATPREQKRIAGVFRNRLRKGWSLGADPTVRFAVRKMRAPLRKDDLRINSPYNTRRFTGLPPGPICSPGANALRAALRPEKTNMMFFVAKEDGSREHYFSVTYAEHNAYKARAVENRTRIRNVARARKDSLALEAARPPEAEKAPAVPDKTAPVTATAAPAPVPKIQEPKTKPKGPALTETP